MNSFIAVLAGIGAGFIAASVAMVIGMSDFMVGMLYGTVAVTTFFNVLQYLHK